MNDIQCATSACEMDSQWQSNKSIRPLPRATVLPDGIAHSAASALVRLTAWAVTLILLSPVPSANVLPDEVAYSAP
jgi:hypothetical protein